MLPMSATYPQKALGDLDLVRLCRRKPGAIAGGLYEFGARAVGRSWRLHITNQVAEETRDQESGDHHEVIDLRSRRDENGKD